MLVNTPIIHKDIHLWFQVMFKHQFRDPVVNKDAKGVSLQVRFATGGAPECKEALIKNTCFGLGFHFNLS